MCLQALTNQKELECPMLIKKHGAQNTPAHSLTKTTTPAPTRAHGGSEQPPPSRPTDPSGVG